jgi:3-dehydroquinate synthase
MSFARLELRHAHGVTPVWIGAAVLDEVRSELDEIICGRRLFAITSRPLMTLHGGALERLGREASDCSVLEVPDGEQAKTVENAAELWSRLLVAGGKRDSLVVAFGGGSIGDLAGFVAGCFLRGIDVIQVPTTLLAQVDAAIGGKTAVNRPQAKNSVGVFHQPLAVVSDTRFLATLKPRQLRSGLFEVIKTGAILDVGLLDLLEATYEDVLAADPVALAPVVERTAAAKIRVVEEDPEEQDRRRLLNFGHTLGHALEMTAGNLEHGEAVGYGMLFAIDLALERGFSALEAERIRGLVRRLGLPLLPEDLNLQDVQGHLMRDKKARESGISWVLPTAPGRAGIFDDVSLDDVEARIASFVAAAC